MVVMVPAPQPLRAGHCQVVLTSKLFPTPPEWYMASEFYQYWPTCCQRRAGPSPGEGAHLQSVGWCGDVVKA